MARPVAQDDGLTGISVAYNQKLKPAIKMSKRARTLARRDLEPFGMSSAKKKLRPVDPKQNNVNNSAVIIPPGQDIK